MTMPDRIRVVLLFGGTSSEHSISCATASGVLGALDRDRFEVIPVGITRGGAMTLQADDASALALDAEALPEVVENGTRVRWPEDASSREPPRARRRRRRALPRARRRRVPDPPRHTGRGRHRPGDARCSPASRTWARACSPPRSAWTSTSRRPCCATPASPWRRGPP
ncbi:hypothetical protein WDV94_07415 [Clavibacter tessellarius]